PVRASGVLDPRVVLGVVVPLVDPLAERLLVERLLEAGALLARSRAVRPRRGGRPASRVRGGLEGGGRLLRGRRALRRVRVRRAVRRGRRAGRGAGTPVPIVR